MYVKIKVKNKKGVTVTPFFSNRIGTNIAIADSSWTSPTTPCITGLCGSPSIES